VSKFFGATELKLDAATCQYLASVIIISVNHYQWLITGLWLKLAKKFKKDLAVFAWFRRKSVYLGEEKEDKKMSLLVWTCGASGEANPVNIFALIPLAKSMIDL
jgi:hypothetical protein